MTRLIDLLLTAISKRRSLGALLVVVLVGILTAIATFSDWRAVEEFENRSWDWRLRLTADANHADKNIKLIIVDQGTLDFFEQEYGITWPFPRDIYTYVIDFLTKAHAKGLAFDLLFTESSAQAVETDQQLANSSQGSLPVVHALTLERAGRQFSAEKFAQFSLKQRASEKQRGFAARYLAGRAAQEFVSTTLPIPELIEKAQGLGSVSAISDSDGIFRHYSVGGRIGSVPVLSLPFELYDLVEKPKQDFGIDDYLDQKAKLAIRLHGPSGTYKSFSLKDVAQSQQSLTEGQKPAISLDEFKDAWVILGVWAPGLLDLRPTPLEEKGKGVEYVAAVLDNILHRDFVKKLNLFKSFLLALSLLILAVSSVFFFSRASAQFGSVLIIGILFLSISLYLAQQAIWIPVFIPALAMFLSVLLSLGILFQVEGRQHRFVRGAFQYYVSKGVIDQIMSDPSRLSLGGEKRELTIFFSDIKGFTSISEKLDAVALVQLLNEYLTAMTDIILQSGGTVDKYVGDAVVAFWGAPLIVADHAVKGVQAAINCQQALERLREKLLKQFGVEVHTRIGLHTGTVSVGNFGSKTRFNYTMIGDAANLASRLEGVNKVFGTPILISNDTKLKMDAQIDCRKVADLRVVGKNEVVTVFQPKIDEPYFADSLHMSQYSEAIRLFCQGKLAESRLIFVELKADPVAQAYVKRIDQELDRADGEFSPVWNMTDK
jgi:adenylate cyclase